MHISPRLQNMTMTMLGAELLPWSVLQVLPSTAYSQLLTTPETSSFSISSIKMSILVLLFSQLSHLICSSRGLFLIEESQDEWLIRCVGGEREKTNLFPTKVNAKITYWLTSVQCLWLCLLLLPMSYTIQKSDFSGANLLLHKMIFHLHRKFRMVHWSWPTLKSQYHNFVWSVHNCLLPMKISSPALNKFAWKQIQIKSKVFNS